jgi:hypothetical protein
MFQTLAASKERKKERKKICPENLQLQASLDWHCFSNENYLGSP